MVATVSAIAQATNVEKGPGASIGSDGFLKLLLEQMKQQDPLSPNSSQDIMMQMSSVSSLQQMVAQNEKLDEILQTSSVQSASNLVGRQIRLSDGLTTSVAAAELRGQAVFLQLQNGGSAPLSQVREILA